MLVAALAGCGGSQPHRALPSLGLGEPAFPATLQAYASVPIVGGNRVDVLLNGEQIFPAVLAAIAAARTTITYAQHVWDDGPVAHDIAAALAERCRAGIGVNVLLDGVGARAMPGEQVDLLRRSGCHVARVRPDEGGRRNHRRILVVDGLVGFTGASGVSRRWMGDGRAPGHWRDTDVRIEGPVVEQLQAAFAESWLEATGIALGGPAYFPRPRPVRGPVYAHVVRSSPAAGVRTMYTTLLLALTSARRSIMITNPALRPDAPLATALRDAARRGVRVTALLPGDGDLERSATARLRDLQSAGIEVHAYEAARLNARTVVVDGVWAAVGSLVVDAASFGAHDEVSVVIYSAAVAQRLEAAFQDDLRHARRLTGPRDRRSDRLRRSRRRRVPLDAGPPAGRDEAVDGQHDDRADHGHDEPRGFTFSVQADRPSQPPPEQRADDAQDDGDDDAPRVGAWHDQASHEAHDETEDDPQQNVHRRTPFAGQHGSARPRRWTGLHTGCQDPGL